MPIYEYRCSSCGHQQEFLQKVSDTPLTVCTQCAKETFSKMLTAAGFHLKGSGWYATDFKNRGDAPAKAADAKSPESKTESKAESKAESKTESKTESKPAGESKSEGGKESSGPASGTGTPPA